MDPNDDIAVEEIRDGATVHLPHGCPGARLIEGPFPAAYRVDPFEVSWCPHADCFPSEASWRTRWPSNGAGHYSPTFSPSPSREVIPNAQHA